MFGAAIFSALLAVTSAQGFPPGNLPSTCAATLCVQGTICREVLNPRTGVVSGQCLSNTQTPTQKPGQCPVQQPGSVGICASNCRSDSDCQGAQKCCRNPCGALTCQNPAQTRPSCSNVRCGPGQTCVLQQVRCIRAPCYPQPVCVYQRQQQFTCANVRCAAGYVCRDTQVQCFRAPCPTRPVCTKTVIVTPGGRCPLFASYVDPSCYRGDQCASGNGYSGCTRGTLCCSTPCGRQCVRPQY
ncbi:keratin-associated protein 4-1-like isoform X2 [Littorina saxatilis]|uniref:keratin-associated protein 4-1-like isoform X2 n=1 Tax=Littorina saxatilis TaxID=31220 RepID=UPI0038B66C13